MFGFSPDALLTFLGTILILGTNIFIKFRIDTIEHHINGMSARIEEGAYREGTTAGKIVGNLEGRVALADEQAKVSAASVDKIVNGV